jgi:hypothetical protein
MINNAQFRCLEGCVSDEQVAEIKKAFQGYKIIQLMPTLKSNETKDFIFFDQVSAARLSTGIFKFMNIYALNSSSSVYFESFSSNLLVSFNCNKTLIQHGVDHSVDADKLEVSVGQNVI